ncbi:MAG: signal peptide peptidase SppA, partial [Calditrichaeota bacterium]|nr:signal peptide peptidase SppA [Calditrichota bacterium]
ICSSRGFSENEFDRLIDSVVFLTPNQAIKEGLIDTLGRWTDADNIIEQFSGRNLSTISSPKLLKNALPFQKWGFKPKIAVVYALGECAMDEGIHARWLDRIFRKLEKDHEVKAVVFRVDSPGGDGMASDVVAQAVRECRKKKPVIVTQGQVAGSGGYWISVYGSRILAAPNTITGSIGVIGGWVYDKGFSDKLGMTSDFVKRGAHADLGYGIGMAGLRLPSRNLDKQEQKRVEEIILEYYENFIGIVAEGRNMAPEKVKSIAQGRFYSGLDGRQNGLIDNIGNLLDALEEAEKAAGLKPGDEIEIIQYPENKGLINLEGIVRQAESPVEASSVYRYLKMVSDHPAEPLPMMIPGTYPEIDQ